MKLEVIGARCIVKEDKLDEKTKSGIIIPGREKEPTFRGTVIAVGDGAYLENGTKIPMHVKEGDRVVYSSFSGSPIQADEDKEDIFVVLNERDILCIIEE